MKSTIDGKRRQKGVKNGAKMPISYDNVYKTPYNGTKAGYGSTDPKSSLWVLKMAKIPIFSNNVYRPPYIEIKPGIIAKVSFQAATRKINLTLLCNRYKEE